jgi:tetratricopeptide (TPR) repeat protein
VDHHVARNRRPDVRRHRRSQPPVPEAISSSEELAYVSCSAHAELAGLAALQGNHALARRHLERARELAPTTGVRDSMAIVANAGGLAARFRGDLEEAKSRHLQALDLFEELRSKIGIAQTRCFLGDAQHALGHAGAAARHFGEALTLAHEIGRFDLMAAALEDRDALPLPTTRRPVPSCSALPPISV